MFSFNFYDAPAQEKEEEVEYESGEIISVFLEELVSRLPNTLAFSLLDGLPRRELWHVKMQIMQSDESAQLLGESDLIKGSYEGGLKTWECSVDLAKYLSHQRYPDELSVLEVFSPSIHRLC